jgi:TM2 domain-containing membrane protein YozV
MDQQKTDTYIIANSKYFKSNHLMALKPQLERIDDSKWTLIQTIQYKDPVISLIISLFFGHLGIDRFLLGDIGLGVGKLLTCGGLGIWYLIDLFLIMDDTKEKNYENTTQLLMSLE